MKKLITLVGTSLFRNYLETNSDIKRYWEVIKDGEGRNRTIDAWDEFSEEIERIRKPVLKWAKNNYNASAEIKSTLSIQSEVRDDLEVYLLATDTLDSRLASQIIKEVLDGYKSEDGKVINVASIKTVRGLQVFNRSKLEKEGLTNLVDEIYKILEYYSPDEQNVLLNITGGYKCVVPYLTILAQINQAPLYYIFDETEELIRIPQTPLDIDWGMFEKYKNAIYELEKGVNKSWSEFKREHGIGEDFKACIYEFEDGILLSPIGEMFMRRYENFFVVKMPVGGKYFEEEETKKRQLKEAIRDLYYKLMNLSVPFEQLTDNIIKHAAVRDSWIFKYNKRDTQIRIQYKFNPDNKEITIFNYYFKKGNVEEDYSKRMAEEYEDIRSGSFTFVTFEK
ncbi:MAG: putative CRISPR-associated protein [Firmicutes bacterium]|nr:putative CRISPR-associated protein [Bacillota bacterium]